MNVAYKHLDARLRIADLTVGQWGGVLAGAIVALSWWQWLSPFGTYITLFSAIYIGSLPAGAALFAGYTEFDLVLFLRSLIRWRREPGRYIAGPGEAARGYVVIEDADGADAPRRQLQEIDLARLWDS